MKILIYGAGIQGSYLAHVLLQNPQNTVTLLARNKRLQELKTSGLVLYHQLQKKHTVNHERLHYIEQLAPNATYDLIFLTMKYNDFPNVLPTLAANASQNIFFIGNQLAAENIQQELTRLSHQPKNIFFGFQTTGGTRRKEEITILRFGRGKLKISAAPQLAAVTPLLQSAFTTTAYSWEIDDQLDEWLKSHAVFITVLNMYEKLHRQTSAKKTRKEYMRLAAKSYQEVFQILQAAGYKIRPASLKLMFAHPTVAYFLMRFLFATPIMSMQQGDFREIIALANSLVTLQRKTNISAPHFQQLCALAMKD